MSTSTYTPTRSSRPSRYLGARDPGNQAALALLRRAGEQARLLRQRRAPFEPESAADAARNRVIVALDLHAGAWHFGQARRPEDEPRPQQSPRQAAALAKGREIVRRRREAP